MTSSALLGTTARLAVLLPVLASLAGLLLPRGHRSRAAGIALVGSVATLLVAVLELVATHGGHSRSSIGLVGHADTGLVVLGLSLRADRLSALVAVAVALVALCVQLYSTAYLAHDRRYPAYAAEVSLFTAAMLLVVQADDLVLLLVGWEVMGLCSYLLVGHDSERLAARRAAVKAFLVTRVGDVGFVLGIITIVAATRTASDVRAAAPGDPAGAARLGLAARPAVPGRRGRRQVGAVPAAHLAAGRHGGADPDLRADPRRDDGGGGSLRRRPAAAAVRESAAARDVLAVDRLHLDAGRRAGGVRPGRPQAAAGLLHDQPGRVHARRAGRGAGRRRRSRPGHRPPAGARRLQGPAVPGRRHLHLRQRHDGC